MHQKVGSSLLYPGSALERGNKTYLLSHPSSGQLWGACSAPGGILYLGKCCVKAAGPRQGQVSQKLLCFLLLASPSGQEALSMLWLPGAGVHGSAGHRRLSATNSPTKASLVVPHMTQGHPRATWGSSERHGRKDPGDRQSSRASWCRHAFPSLLRASGPMASLQE